MPINKDLSVSPYFDDFNEEKNFYRVLFKPGTAVQVRELNQLQTLLQNQIEKFGNNIFKRGTIIDGVNFVYHSVYPFVKIDDSQLDGIPADPDLYVGNFAVDPTNNLTAYIVNSLDGYEATDPDLKTLYVRYINSGNTGLETAFEAGTTLKVYDYLDSMNRVIIGNGSSGFANTDSIIFCSALAVTVTSNAGFTVGETITQDGNTHVAIIDAIETVKNKTVLRIRPRQTDLSNTAIAMSIWEFTTGNNIIGSVSSATAVVNERIGSGAIATLTTTADVGKVTDVMVTARGSKYWVAPYVSIKSSGTESNIGSRNYNDLSLTGRNYIAQITVSENNGSVGNGYAFSVTEGVIYQKGYFLRVAPQTVIVTKYHNKPDQLAIGFDSIENIVDSNADDSLLDNATGSRNQFAPGADRLNIDPQLVVISSEAAAANNEFFSIVEFSEGYAYRENKRTQFNSIMDEMAIRTSEQSGNFILDKFLVTTGSTSNQALEGQQFAVVTDPGRGYINGYRVETQSNYYKNVDKGIDSRSAANLSASIDYGNYVLVDEFAGAFNFNTAGLVDLMSLPANWMSTMFGSELIPPALANSLGTARVRNIVYDSGEVGTATARYRVYLFDIKMNPSKSFKDVRSLYDASDIGGLADIVLTYDATTNTEICQLEDTNTGTSLLIDTGSDATRNLNNLTYVYRATNNNVEFAPNGTLSTTLATVGEYFAYDSSSLTDIEKDEITLVPTEGDIILQINASANGTASVTTGSNNIVLSNASTVNKYNIGEYIALYSGPGIYNIRRITGKQSNTISLDAGAAFTNGTANISKIYPIGVPIALGTIPSATVTLSGGGSTLNVNLGTPIETPSNLTCSITYDVRVSNTTPQAKNADRNNFVKLSLANNAGSTLGPWCVGIPDAFRLRKVYLSNASTVNTNSTDVTDQFYLDHNQSADYYGLGYLYKKNDATIKLTSGTYLLVQLDAFTSSAGVYTINSYVSANTAQRFADDALALDDLGVKINSFEIPEVYSASGDHFDLINCIDFRPVVANTAAYAKTAAAATVNPSQTVTFGNNNKKFPLPETGVSFDRSYFLGRKDVVVINTNNKINVLRGVPSDTLPYPEPKVPQNTIILSKINVPSYPCVPQNFSANTAAILDRKMANERMMFQRVRDKTIVSETTQSDVEFNQPKAFTMSDLNKLERRVSDLEYTVSLSLVESDLKDKIIPSSINPAINRFKFGFFVDDYTTKKNSDLDNPEYQADVIDSRVVPVTESTLVTHGQGYRLSNWETEFKLINQDQASEPIPVVVPPPATQPPPAPPSDPVVVTPPSSPPSVDPGPPVVVPPPSTPPSAPPPAPPVPVITAKEVSVFRSQRNEIKKKYDEFVVNMSSVPSTFNLRYRFYGSDDKLTIVKYRTDNIIDVLYNSWTEGNGTLYFNHDPSTGRDYTFRVNRDSDKWEYTLNYPIDNITYTETVSPPTTNLNTIFYTGVANYVNPGYFSAQELSQNFAASNYLSQGTSQTISVSGLKPSTMHNIAVSTYAGEIIADTIVTGSNLSTEKTVMTDENGSATFTIQVSLQGLNNLNQLSGYGVVGTSQPSSIIVSMISADYTSSAIFYINAKTADSPPLQPVTPWLPSDPGGGDFYFKDVLNNMTALF